jgi:hypothetical protein
MASADRPPTSRNIVRLQRDAHTFLHGYEPLPLSNPIADAIRTHFQTQDADLRARFYHHTTNITDPIHYQCTHNNVLPRSTHLLLLNRMSSLWEHGITQWSQLAALASPTQLILKPASHIKRLEDVPINISTPYTLYLHSVLIEPATIIHNRLPPNPLNSNTPNPLSPHTLHGYL